RLTVTGAGISVSRSVEVPAGGRQVYELGVPALPDGTRLTVSLVDASDEVIASQVVTVRSSSDEMAVGVMGADRLIATLGRVRTIVTDRPVDPLVVPADAPPTTFDVLDYLVLADETRLDDALDWARGGGRLVLGADSPGAAGLSLTPLPTGVDGVTSAALGAGRIILVKDLEARTGDDWASILRPTALDLANSPEWGMADQGGGLVQAASESGSRQVPSLPWLLFAILGFALVIGPINFLVLSRLGKRDWAWVTIPGLALLAVIGFWVAGRQRIAGTNVSHASLVVADGSVRARSAVIVAAGTAGDRTLGFDPMAQVYPERSQLGGGGAELRMESDNRVRVSLDQLGFMGLGVIADDSSIDVPRVSISGNDVTVANDSDLDYWGWGVVGGGRTLVAPSHLAPGGEGSIRIGQANSQPGFSFIDAVVNGLQLWDDPDRTNSLWPFAQVLTSSIDEGWWYFVGMTDDYQPGVTVDGARPVMPGTTMVLVRVADAGPDPGSTGSVGASVVGTGFINWLDWTNQRVIATDELTVGFLLPDPSVAPRLRDTLQFGAAPDQYLAWDWGSGEFIGIDRNEVLTQNMVSPDGQVYVRLMGQELGDNPFSPDSLSLEWDT
ncbi:MAG: hypothetical protein WB239_05635, partial [Acidimicrobiia bacterium]